MKMEGLAGQLSVSFAAVAPLHQVVWEDEREED